MGRLDTNIDPVDFGHLQDFEIAVDGRILVNDGEIMLSAATAGLGLSYLIDASVLAHLADKRLVRVLEAYCVPFPGFFLYYPSRAHIAPKLKDAGMSAGEIEAIAARFEKAADRALEIAAAAL